MACWVEGPASQRDWSRVRLVNVALTSPLSQQSSEDGGGPGRDARLALQKLFR